MKFRGFNTTTKIGIGTTAPARTLDVQGPAGNDDVIAIRHASGGSSWLKLGFWNGTTERASIRTQDDASHVSIFCSTTERLRIMSDGNVGIGTTAPSRLFDVNGTSYFRDDIYFGNTVLNPASGFNTQIGMGWDKSTGQFQIAASSTTALQVGRITTAGVIQQWRYAGTVVASLESSGQVRSLGGALSAPSFSFTNDTTTGMSRPTTGAINFVTAGTERVRIAADGKVGIGGTPTVAQLDILSSVSGNYLYMDDGANCLWKISSTTTSGIIQTQATGWSSWKPMDLRANYFQFKPNNSEIMRILSTGVGIGTTVPSGLLDLYEPASGDNKLRFHSSATGTGTSNGSRIGLNGTELFINNLESSTIKIYTQSTATNGITIASDGKVGIGSTTPLDKLHVQGNILQLDGSPEYHFGTISASHLNWRVACQEVVSQGFEIASGTASAGTSAPSDTYTNRFVIKGATGQIQFNSYGGGTHTGTSAYKLSVDSSGNIIETSIGSGAVDGAGTTNYISKWTDSDTIGNSSIVDNATSVYISKNTIIGRNQSMNPRLVLSSAAKSANLGKADTGMALCIDSGTSDSNQSVGHLTQIGLGLINAYQPAAIGAMVSNAAAYTSTHLVFATRPTTTDVAPTERMRIQDDGKVGIGTTAPSSRLTINGGIGSHATGLTFGDGDTGFYENSDDSMWYFSGGVDRWKSDSGYLLSTITTFKATIVNEVATATNPVYTFYTDLDTGLGHAAANQLSLIAGGVKAAVVTSTGFGIRTTPATGVILDVRDSGDANTKQYLINTGQTTAGRETEYIFGKDNGANLSAVLKYYYHTTQASRRIDLLHYITNAGLSILNTGSIGINDTAPDHMLTLKGGTVNGSTRYPGINGKQGSSTLWAMSQWYGNEGYIGLYLNNTRTIQFRAGETAGGAAHSYINTGSGNNFGVGTATPGAKLEIQGDTSARALLAAGSSTSAAVGYFYTNAIHTGVDTSSIVSIRSDHASSTGKVLHVRGDGSGNLLTLNQGGTDRLVVQADGNVGIGTTAPSALFHVYESSAGEKNWYMENAGSGVGQLNIKGGSGRYMSLARSGTMGTILVDGAFKIMNHSGGWNTSIYCTAAGDVGIGHSNVYYKLDVSGTFRATGQAYLNGGLRLGGANSNFAGERLFNMPSFANGVANQKIDLYWTGAFWGYFEIEITSGYSHQNATGVLTKSFAFGANVSNAIYLNESWYSNVGGLTHGNFAISGITWDSTNSRYRIQIVHRVSTANGMTLKMRCLGASAAHADTFMSGTTVGSVYTTDTTAFALAVVQLAAPNDNAWVDGYLGIGTATPAARLHAHNTSSGSTWLKIGNATRADGMLIGCDSNELQQIYVNGANPLTFWTNDTERIRIAGDGNVGIGTNAPKQKLHIFQTEGGVGVKHATIRLGGYLDKGAEIAAYRTASNSNNMGLKFSANNVTNGIVDVMTLDDTGRVGIGTTEPVARLHVGSAIISSDVAVRIETDNASTYTPALQFAWGGDVVAEADFQYDTRATTGFKIGTTAATHPMSFVISDVTKMYIDGAGLVGIGTTAPDRKFHVVGTDEVARFTGTDANPPTIEFENSTGVQAKIGLKSGHDFIIDTAGEDIFMGAAATEFTIKADGNVGIGTTTPVGRLEVSENSGTTAGVTKLRITARTQGAYDGDAHLEFAYNDWGNVNVPNLLASIQGLASVASPSNVGGELAFATKALGGATTALPVTHMTIKSDGNIGIGTSSPAATLHVRDTTASTGRWTAAFVADNAATVSAQTHDHVLIQSNDVPSLKLYEYGQNQVGGIAVGDNNTTIASTETLRFFVNGSATGNIYDGMGGTLAIYIKTDGNVGIGTSAPSTGKFNVGYTNDVAPIVYAQGSEGLVINATRHDASNYRSYIDFLAGRGSDATNGGASMRFFTQPRSSAAPIQALTLQYDGKVGIGVTAPTGLLSLPADEETFPQIRFQSEYGTTLADCALSTEGDSGGTNLLIGSNQYYSGGTITRFTTDRSGSAINFGYTGRMSFYTGSGNSAPSVKMSIISDGNVGIGNTSPAYRLEVTGSATADWISKIHNTGTTSTPSGLIVKTDYNVATATGGYLLGLLAGTDYRLVVQNDGNVGIGTITPAYALDVVGYAKVSLGIKVGGGSAGNSTNPAITVGSVNTAGVYFESSGVGFGSGSSTKKLFLRSDGDVGIGYSGSIAPPYGTTSPTILIIKPRQQSSDAALRLARFADDVVGLDIWADGGSGTHDSYFDNRYELSDWIFRSGTRGAGTIDEVMRVTGEGNVGIGTTDVRGTLQIGSGNGGGNVPAGRELVFGANNSEIMFLSANDASSVDGTIGAWNTVYNVQNSKIEFHKNTWNMGQLKFYTNNGAGITERMVIANTGHVGIGTTTPVTQNGDVGLLVSLYSATSSKNLALSLAYTGGTDAQWAILEGRNNSSPAGDKRVAQIALGNPDGAQQDRGAITFGVFHDGAYEEAARIISDGNVGINTNAPSQALHVKGNVNVTDAGNASYGTILFGDNASRFIRGNSAEVQIGPTINQLHFLKTNGAGQIATSAANGTTAIQILARIAHTSGNILEVLNASTSVMTVDYSGILTTPYMIATNSIASGGCNPRTDNAHDLGNQSYRWRQLHLGNFYVTGSVFAANTADGYDNKETYICAGGSQSSTRGSYIDMTGNDYPTWGGLINLVAGEGANAKVAITTGGAERMSISTGGLTKFSGSVGIGTVPGDLLHIYGTRPTIRLQGGSGLWMMRSDDNQSHRFEIIDANGGYDKFAIYPGNTGAIVLHSDGAGCVGIGTTSPSERLQVVGNAYIQAPAAGAEVSVSIMQQGGNVNYHDCRIKFQQSDGWQIEAMNHNANGNNAYDFGINYNRNAYAGDFYIANNGTKNFFLKANGKVGIGTNPTARLYVVETANNAWALQVKGTGTSANYGLEVNCSAGYALSSQPFKVETPSGGPFFIDGNSNVIIGGTTSNLTYNNGLQITNASNVANLKLKSGSSTGLDLWQDTGGSGYIIVHDNAPLYLRTNNVTRLTISAGGGITLANNQILSVGTGASNSSGKVRLYGANANDFYMDWMPLASERQFRFAGKASTSDYKTYFTQAGTGKHNLWVSGTLEAVGACTLASGGATSTFGGCVGIGVNPGYMLQVNGSFAATSKSFVIDHPIKPDYMLEYGALEGPEFGVYHRGRVESDTITLPDYWSGLVRDGTITVQLTPNGSFQHLYVVSTSLTEIKIGAAEGETIDCYYTIYGERADLDPLVVEKIV